jgi:hypothetical protein
MHRIRYWRDRVESGAAGQEPRDAARVARGDGKFIPGVAIGVGSGAGVSVRLCGGVVVEAESAAAVELFVGSDAGGRRAAIAYTILSSCRINAINPVEYLTDVLPRLVRGGLRQTDAAKLLPAAWRDRRSAQPDASAQPDTS